jgi:hypothetical protein
MRQTRPAVDEHVVAAELLNSQQQLAISDDMSQLDDRSNRHVSEMPH